MSLDEDLAGEILFESESIIRTHVHQRDFSGARSYLNNLVIRLRKEQLDCIGYVYNSFLDRVHYFRTMINRAENIKPKIYIGDFHPDMYGSATFSETG
jgi:hypothetical protein